MLLVKASSTCDVCLEHFQLKGETSPTARVPCAIDCGHIFCSICINSFTRLTCPLCRSYIDPLAVRRLHIDAAPQTPDSRPTRVDHTSSKEDLKDRIISIVRKGADGGQYQALIQETCAWLKEQTAEEHWDLRALYLLLTRYHQMHKEEQAATVSLHEKTRLHQDALRKVEKRQLEISDLKQAIEDLKDEMDSNEVKWAVREKHLTMKYDEAIEETRHLREQLMTICAPKGRSDRHRSSDGRHTNQRVFEPMVEDECQDDTLAPVKPIVEHFSPLPVHLSPMPPTTNAVSPLVKIGDSVDEEDHYFKPRSQSPEDEEHTPVEYPPPLMATPASKPMVIGAAIARFYDMAASETSASLPHPTPSAYYNRRHEKEKEKLRELSRNNSSGGTGRVPLSRIRALQEKLVPESGDEAERTRSNRRQLLNAILADAPTPQSTPAPIHAPPPPTPPPPPPLPPAPLSRRPTAISRASTAAEEIERERERRRKQSNENRGPETPIVSVPSHPQPQPQPQPPQPPTQTHAQRLARPRASTLSLKDVTHAHGVEEGMRRGPVYSERRSATERRPSTGKPQWHRSSPDSSRPL